MDRMLKKMAKQLNSYDEASLMSLWNEYARRVQAFEPTQEWEENTLIFCLIQAASWKNQLFNFHMAANFMPSAKDTAPPFVPFLPQPETAEKETPTTTPGAQHKATRLRFPGK